MKRLVSVMNSVNKQRIILREVVLRIMFFLILSMDRLLPP